jgi:superfamily II DNA or RNA helicase
MSYAVGSLVRTRGREWVVLPDSTEEYLVLRPLGGTEDEITGILTSLETIQPATFQLPGKDEVGDYRSCRLLRDAVRLGFRSSAGPFRSFAKIAVEPRPYQLVPLLMALKLDTVRLLIADDVGIGKTIEACTIARELLDRGEIQRLAVLCPPQLAEQWHDELLEKFHIDCELVLPSTASSLERNLPIGKSIFEEYPFVVVSMDFIKSDRHREDFLRACPEFVIVDEAHTCAFSQEGRGGRHQRHQLIKGLSENPNRHMIFVTATPHSGKEDQFRSLLTLLKKEFASLPDNLSSKESEQIRRKLAMHFIQRRRADIRHYMQADTPFPERLEAEENYNLSAEYKKLFNRVLNYARETVLDSSGNLHRQRIRWWSALALLRSLASSPAAAAETLRNRAATVDTETASDADEIGRRSILDLETDDTIEGSDVAPGSDIGEMATDEKSNRRRLLEMAREADALQGDKDEKLKKGIKLIEKLIKDGFSPIVFCRFIPTAEYVAAELRKILKGVEVAAITGTLPPAEREERVAELAKAEKHVLVCTDCLSEGINLQQHFDAVVHYDLSWNPTRHEQREGRVDRYGQPKSHIRVVTYYGIDNQIDGIVLDVLIRKHKQIRSSLGISVPVPADTNQVMEAVFEGLLLREKSGVGQQYLPGFEEYFKPQKEDLFGKWDNATEREKRSRTMFAQESIKVDEVAAELKEVQSAIGSSIDVAAFSKEAFRVHGAIISENHSVKFYLKEVPRALREMVGDNETFKAKFELPVEDDVIYLNRTHPVVEGLATYIMDTALDPISEAKARRAGVIRTKQVAKRTTLLLVRFRYHIITKQENKETPLLAEDCQLLAFSGSPQNAQWLNTMESEALLNAKPEGNILPEQSREFLSNVIDGFDHIRPHLEETARIRGDQILESYQRVRRAAGLKGVTYRIDPKLPPDVLGIYIYLPVVS